MYIPSKYAMKEGTQLPNGEALVLKCKVCGTPFAIPSNEVTSELAAAMVCDHPDCVKAAADAAASAELNAAKPDPDKTSTMV